MVVKCVYSGLLKSWPLGIEEGHMPIICELNQLQIFIFISPRSLFHERSSVWQRMSYTVRKKTLRSIQLVLELINKDPKDHKCSKNKKGSSKAMDIGMVQSLD